jgi:hypothetical protein
MRNDLEKLFITICLVVLFRDYQNLVPDYILEKIGKDFDVSIYYYLDSSRRKQVLEYFETWGINNILEEVGIFH